MTLSILIALIFFLMGGTMLDFAQEDQSSIANPASVYCIDHGGKDKIVTIPGGSQSGICVFPDSSQCEEWKYFRGECHSGQIFESTNSTIPEFSSTVSIILVMSILATIFVSRSRL